MPENTWLRHDDESFNDTERHIAAFARVYESIGLNQNDFSGTTLFGGVGGVFPERAFICSPESRYREIYPRVKKVVLCDVDYYPRSMVLKEPITHQIMYQESQDIADGKVVSIQDSIWGVLELINLRYNAITFCRVPDLPEQLSPENLMLIADRLNRGGLALLSGSTRWGYANLEEATETVNAMRGMEARLHKLTDGGDLMNLGLGGHSGIVIRKK